MRSGLVQASRGGKGRGRTLAAEFFAIALALAAGLQAQQVTQPATAPAREPSHPPTSYLTLQTDPENCLSCHRFRGLSRVEPGTGDLRLFFCSADYYAQRMGPHARLRCTACHEAEEVKIIPHQVRTPVDCTRACHIVPSSGVEIHFSHDRMHQALQQSVHAPEKLQTLQFDPPLLRPGQSVCLYCHDQPVYRNLGEIPRPVGHADVTARCDLCHGEQMPADVLYYAHHVTARLQPARPIQQLAQVCAVCHSDSKIIAQMPGGSHDTVASYLHSFHGKAKLLGSEQTATCLDCHASQEGDVHLMRASTDPESSINAGRLPTTCRTTQCHPGAPPGMSQAAVHLDLDPHERSPEFYVAAMFVALTAAVMVVFFILIILDLFNTVVRRRDPHHERTVRLARALQEDHRARHHLVRMSVHQRFQHWLLAITFITLVLTGMPIKFADAHWAKWVITLFGGLPMARWIHRVCGVILMAAFAYHLAYLLIAFIERVRNARAAGDRKPIWWMLLNSPMMITPLDVKQFFQLFAYLLFLRKERPRFGHYNFMQKFEYWAVFWGIPVMGLSGLVLWGAPGVSEYISGRVLNFAFIIHSDEAYLAFIYIAVVHIFSVILTPAVFPVSPGTLTGQVPPEELVEGHLGEVQTLAEEHGITPEMAEEEREPRIVRTAKSVTKRFYSAGLLAVTATIGFVSISFLLHLLFTRQTAPVEIREIPKRLDTQVLLASTAPPQGNLHGDEAPPRGPLAHFHRIPHWFEPDPRNNCATSGCHGPLPHGKRIETRAFLNMHATFVDCNACHAADAQKQGLEAKWFDLPSREPQGTPAVLQLAALLEKPDELLRDPRLVSNRLIPLLRQAVDESGNDRQLREWLLLIETAYPESEPWQEAIRAMAHESSGIRTHVHGEYKAKIGIYRGSTPVGVPTPEQQEAIGRYQAGERGRKLTDKIHEGIAPKGALCTPCHSANPTLMDFRALGYPPARIQSLQDSAVVRQILSIEQGQPFHLPTIEEEPVGR